MKCPACFNQLTEVQVGTLKVDVCQGGCGGIWFDAFELQRVKLPEQPAGEALLDIQRDEHLVIDPARKRACPRCPEIKLYRHWFNAKIRVQVDECPNCGGFWLDAGELGQIRSALSEAAKAAGVKPSLSGDLLRFVSGLPLRRA